jgi:hypothetical protein
MFGVNTLESSWYTSCCVSYIGCKTYTVRTVYTTIHLKEQQKYTLMCQHLFVFVVHATCFDPCFGSGA